MTDEKISRVAIIKAAEAGGAAFRDGKTREDCPFKPAEGIGAEALAHHWDKGFTRAERAS